MHWFCCVAKLCFPKHLTWCFCWVFVGRELVQLDGSLHPSEQVWARAKRHMVVIANFEQFCILCNHGACNLLLQQHKTSKSLVTLSCQQPEGQQWLFLRWIWLASPGQQNFGLWLDFELGSQWSGAASLFALWPPGVLCSLQWDVCEKFGRLCSRLPGTQTNGLHHC